jgi:hypothetical protein
MSSKPQEYDDDAAPPVAVADTSDTGEGGKIKMIVQLVKKCLGVKDIASMYVLLASLGDWLPMGALAGNCPLVVGGNGEDTPARHDTCGSSLFFSIATPYTLWAYSLTTLQANVVASFVAGACAESRVFGLFWIDQTCLLREYTILLTFLVHF